MDKNTFREQIDNLDSQILDLLEKRIACAKEIGKIKLEHGEDIYVPSRESRIFENLSRKNAGRIDEDALKAIYREIISASISAEKKLQVAYLGPVATFTQQAAMKNFGSSVEYRPMHSIPDIFASVELGECDYGVLPIENSTEGAVFHTMDMLAESKLMIVGQIYLKIEQCAISRGKLADIRKICSKDQAIGQCRGWIRRNLPNADIEYVESTSLAVRLARENPEIAAIASEIAADAYGV
ncbi:MAG: chorismate mutase, partial [Opitutales bacterium]|nr:chorismate mutase [Opitutales bacterium]